MAQVLDHSTNTLCLPFRDSVHALKMTLVFHFRAPIDRLGTVGAEKGTLLILTAMAVPAGPAVEWLFICGRLLAATRLVRAKVGSESRDGSSRGDTKLGTKVNTAIG
jgi:hypothetical protein